MYYSKSRLNLQIITRNYRSTTKLRLSSKYSGSVSGLDALTRLAREVAFFDSCCWASGFASSFWLAFLFAPFLIVIRSSQIAKRKPKAREREREGNRVWGLIRKRWIRIWKIRTYELWLMREGERERILYIWEGFVWAWNKRWSEFEEREIGAEGIGFEMGSK